MLKLAKLSTYAKMIRTNVRKNSLEVEALDTRGQNHLHEINIPRNGYILKAGEIYIAEVTNPGSSSYIEKNFLKELTTLGIDCKIVDDECLLTVQRPVRVYRQMNLFTEKEKSA